MAASRKVMECIAHLIANRDRVVSHDELIRLLWGHEEVTNHQLAQVIVASRRAVGDDRQSQSVIRTLSGLGYRWVMPVSESAPEGVSQPVDANAGVASVSEPNEPPSAPDAKHGTLGRRFIDDFPGRMRSLGMATVLLVALSAVGGSYSNRSARPHYAADLHLSDRLVDSPDPLASMRVALRMGMHSEVREAISKLPIALAQTPEARVLEIELEIEHGSFAAADHKLDLQLRQAAVKSDPVWRAKLLVMMSQRHNRADGTAAEVLAPAQSALELLASAGKAAPATTIGEALHLRGVGFLKRDDLPLALRDLMRARSILQKTQGEYRVLNTRRTLATVWLRTGRMTDALEEMVNVADGYRRLGEPTSEIGARNMATRIQAEQMRWDEALIGSKRSMEVAGMLPSEQRRLGAMQLRGLVLTASGRLREALSLLDEVQQIDLSGGAPIFLAVHALAADRPEQALEYAADAFERYKDDDDDDGHLNLVLENREGAMLLWMIAAQRLAVEGGAMPTPSPEQLSTLFAQKSNVGRIAYARWQWSQGQVEQAEATLREVRQRPTAPGWLSDTLYANEAYIALLLERGDVAAAREALAEMWGYDPERFSRDYAANLLALRVAVAEKDRALIASAYQATQALAGERVLPIGLDEDLVRLNVHKVKPASKRMTTSSDDW